MIINQLHAILDPIQHFWILEIIAAFAEFHL